MKNATYTQDYKYVTDILEHTMSEDIKPSFKFTEMLNRFSVSRYRSLQQENNEQELAKYNRFYRVYKAWKTQMGLDGLSKDEISAQLNVHPWKQLKEADSDGIEIVKNKRTRRYWKRQHILKKLKPSCLENLSKSSADTTENTQETDDK